MRVRQAIAYAIDRDAIVAATSYGTAAKNELAIPKGNFWHTDYDKYATTSNRPNGCWIKRTRRPKTWTCW